MIFQVFYMRVDQIECEWNELLLLAKDKSRMMKYRDENIVMTPR